MGATILIVVVCGALLLRHCEQVMAQPPSYAPSAPSVESVTYQVETVDHMEEFSIQAKMYFSVKHEAYRYDVNGGMSKFFIYPKEGKAYYYYPTSDFPNEKFNITACYTLDTARRGSLPSPLPSTDGLPDLGPDHVNDMPAEKYGYESEDELSALWVTTKDAKTGTRPIKYVEKLWYLTREGFRKGLRGHITREYYGFISGEPDSSVWDRPSVACENARPPVVATIIRGLAHDIGLQGTLLGEEPTLRPSAITKIYQRGRSLGASYQNDLLLRDFPWSPKQYESIAETLPKSFDWRDFGAVTKVKNQRQCGNCWAHGTVGSLEGAYFLKYNELVTLSEQAMTDCAGSLVIGTDGCFGGREIGGFTWINRTGGIPPAEDYGQYQESNGYCRITDQTKLVAQLEGYYHIPSNTDALKVALVKLGPIVVSIYSEPLGTYTNGVITGSKCSGPDIDHSVLLVGYGESAEHGPYWIVKNSWDTTWGVEGYFLASAKGNCLNILDEAYFPILK